MVSLTASLSSSSSKRLSKSLMLGFIPSYVYKSPLSSIFC